MPAWSAGNRMRCGRNARDNTLILFAWLVLREAIHDPNFSRVCIARERGGLDGSAGSGQ
jgi:hypothetical protein